MHKIRLPLALAALLIWCGQAFAQQPPLSEAQYLEAVSRQKGWAGERIAKSASRDARRFELTVAGRDNSKRRVCLWDCVQWVTGGQHLPTRRQAIGDCVGFGAAQAVDYLQYVRIVLYGVAETPKPVFVPYHYACGRCAPECGAGRIRGPDGSIGSWQAKALQLYGVVAADHPGLPGYSGSVARSWATKMPSAELIAEGKKHLVRTIALVVTPEQARDAICNGYPVTIASSWGGEMEPPELDGRLVNRRATTWHHQMVLIAYDGSGAEPYWYVLNSWGPNAHGTPPDGSPPGGFWVRRPDLLYIVGQEDCWALSDLDTGFEPRDLHVDGLTSLFGGRTYAVRKTSVVRSVGNRGDRNLGGVPGARPTDKRTGHRGQTVLVQPCVEYRVGAERRPTKPAQTR